MSINKKIGITIDADAKKAIQSFDEVAKKADAAQKATKKLGEFTAGPAGMSIKFNAMAEAASKAINVLQQAAQVIDTVSQRAIAVNNVFGNLSFGIEGARKATRGLVSDFDLAVAANQAMSLGVTNNAKDFAELAGAAQALGARINQGPKDSLESLMTALGRGSTMMLDNLGIVLKETEAYNIYAAQLGKTSSQLTEGEKAEAFRKVAMQKVIEAAKGVTVETDNAAHAVQRFKIEIQNIEDRALGAEDKTASLRDTLRDYVMVNDVSIEKLKAHGSEVLELELAMEDLGVSTSLLNKTTAEWVRLIERAQGDAKMARDEFLRWGRSAEGVAKISAELNAIQTSAQAHAIQIINKDRLHDIERELVLHQSRKAQSREINDLLAEKAEITAKQLELEGKLTEAEEVRFQEELRQLRADVGVAKSGGGRGKKRDKHAGARAEFNDQLLGAQMVRSGKESVTAQEEFEAEERKRITVDANRHADNMFSAEMERAEQRERLKKAEIEREKEAAEATKEAEEAKQRAVEETLQKRMQIASVSQQLAVGTIQLGAMAADAYIKGEERREKAAQRAAGIQAITIGILETVKAAAAIAGFNYVEGAAHIGAAALAFAQGGILLDKAGGASGRGSLGGGGSGFGSGSSFGGGDTGQAANGPSGGGASAPTAPISEQDVQRSGRGGMHGGGGGQHGNGGGQPINITVIGKLTEQDAINLRRQIRGNERVTKKVSNG